MATTPNQSCPFMIDNYEEVDRGGGGGDHGVFDSGGRVAIPFKGAREEGVDDEVAVRCLVEGIRVVAEGMW